MKHKYLDQKSVPYLFYKSLKIDCHVITLSISIIRIAKKTISRPSCPGSLRNEDK